MTAQVINPLAVNIPDGYQPSGPMSRAKRRWGHPDIYQAIIDRTDEAEAKRWRAMKNEEIALALALAQLPHSRNGFIAGMAYRAANRMRITDRQRGALEKVGLSHGVIEAIEDKPSHWRFTELGRGLYLQWLSERGARPPTAS